MAASVALLGWDSLPIRVVQDVDWLLDDRADSTNQVRVTTSLAEADGVDAEQELLFKARRFIISGVERDRAADEAVITADEAQAALADVVIVGFRPNSWTLTRAMNAVLDGTRWTLGEVSGTRYGRADFDEITALDALHFLARHQDAKLSFDSLRRRVNITQTYGTAHEYVFTYGRQLSNIEKSTQQPTTTIIYPVMADDVELPAVEDYGYYMAQGLSRNEAHERFRKEEHWSDSRYEVEENMTRDAQKRLEEEAYPRITYTLTAQATVDVQGADDFDLSELRLGDTVRVWDQEIDTKLSAEVTAVTTSSDQSQNELTLSTLPASLGESVSDRGYFGDSGKPSSGSPRRSGPQPRPSMPILEQMGDYGIAVTRWNGQDADGNFETIPQRFGTLLTLVAPLTDGVIPSPNDSSQTFMGSDITKRGGGLSNIGFNGYGEFAVWHQMRGWDGMTLSELSEPLVVDVPPAWDPQPTVDKVDELENVRLPGLRDDLSDAQQKAESDLSDLDTTLRDSFSTQLDTVLEALSGAGRTWSQDTPPPAGTTYEWAGDPHASESIKRVDGVEVDRNLIANPSFETDVEGWTTGGGTFSISRITGSAATHGNGLLKVEGPQPSTANIWVDEIRDVDASEIGQWTAASIDLRSRNAYPSASFVRLGFSDGGSWSYHTGDLTEVAYSEWTNLTFAYQVPEGTTQIRVMAYFRDVTNGPLPGDFEFWADTVHRAVAPTEAEALAQVSTYFDGDTLDDRQNDLWINGNGTQHRWDEATKTWIAFTNEQLQQSVDQALSKADAALTQAGTKNTVFYGTTEEPEFDGVVAGDQYRQTDSSDDVIARRRWNGVQWLGDAVTSEVIDNLDVGKLTAGSVTTPTAVIEKLMADGITARTATLARAIVAAGNLVPNATGWGDTKPEGWSDFGYNATYRAIFAEGQVSPWNDEFFHLESGQEYSVSIDVRASIPDTTFYVQILSRDGGDSVHAISNARQTLGKEFETFTGRFTVPQSGIFAFRILASYTTGADNSGGYQWFRNISVKNALDGRLIVQGLLQATTAELEELFFDSAVGNTIAAGTGEFLELNADQIRSNSWTGIVATGPTFQTHEAANEGVKMTPAGLRGWDGGGDLSFRFDGSNNFLRGSLHAGLQAGSEVHIDYGLKTRTAQSEEGADSWDIETPYIDFRGSFSYQFNRHPSIYIDEGTSYAGMMFINPGYPSGTDDYRGVLNVGGDIAVNRAVVRNSVQSWSGYQLDRSSNQPGGLTMDDSLRTRLEGRMAENSGPHDMIVHGTSPSLTLAPNAAMRGSVSFFAPAETGIRRCVVSAHVANTILGYDQNRGATASSARASAASMSYTMQAARSNSGDVQAWVYFAAYWT